LIDDLGENAVGGPFFVELKGDFAGLADIKAKVRTS
jgi:hypothetical protein